MKFKIDALIEKEAPRLEKLSTAEICKELWAQLLTEISRDRSSERLVNEGDD